MKVDSGGVLWARVPRAKHLLHTYTDTHTCTQICMCTRTYIHTYIHAIHTCHTLIAMIILFLFVFFVFCFCCIDFFVFLRGNHQLILGVMGLLLPALLARPGPGQARRGKKLRALILLKEFMVLARPHNPGRLSSWFRGHETSLCRDVRLYSSAPGHRGSCYITGYGAFQKSSSFRKSGQGRTGPQWHSGSGPRSETWSP